MKLPKPSLFMQTLLLVLFVLGACEIEKDPKKLPDGETGIGMESTPANDSKNLPKETAPAEKVAEGEIPTQELESPKPIAKKKKAPNESNSKPWIKKESASKKSEPATEIKKSEPVKKEEPVPPKNKKEMVSKPVSNLPKETSVANPKTKDSSLKVEKAITEEPGAKSIKKKTTEAEKKEGSGENEKLAMLTKPEKPETAVKAFALEDQPMPKVARPSAEARSAVAAEESAPVGTGADEKTDNFREAMTFYNQKEYSKAVESFARVPVPSTKKKGVMERDEYVLAQYYSGIANQRMDKLQKAVLSYEKVLQYERYFPVVSMNLGIAYLELNQFARADKAFRNVVRDHNRIPPAQYDKIMERTRYFWALTWTRMHRASLGSDRKEYFKRQALKKWNDYQAWYGGQPKYSAAKGKVETYIKSLETQ